MIETKIDGDPAAFRSAATWITGSLKSSVSEVDHALSAARSSNRFWEGAAANAFRAKAGKVDGTIDDILGSTPKAGSGLRTFATALAKAQSRAQEICQTAAGAGLTVDGTGAIHPPGLCVAEPPPLGDSPTPAQAADFQQASKAAAANAAQWKAYGQAQQDMTKVRKDLQEAENALGQVADDIQRSTVPALSMFSDGFIGAQTARGLAEAGKEIAQNRLDAQALEKVRLASIKTATPETVPLLDDDYAHINKLSRSADDLEATLPKMARAGKLLGAGVGGALTGVAIYQDIHDGESWQQATVSNGAGLGASILAGAGAGALFGSVVPGAGTAVGAVVGAVAGGVTGIVTSGAIDYLWDGKNSDVGKAIGAGWHDVVDTGKAVVDLGATLVKGAGDGLSSAWNAVFD